MSAARDAADRRRAPPAGTGQGSEVEDARASLAAILDATTDLVAMCDPDGCNVQVNRAGRALVGIDPDEDLGRVNALDFFTEVSRSRIREEVLPALRVRGRWQGELTMVSRDGREIPTSQVIQLHRGPDGRARYISTIARDISERKALEQLLAYQALHDPLTGLANRALFEDRMSLAVARGSRSGRLAAVLFFDLDHFKRLNDSLGHAAGDRILAAVGARVRQVVRPADTVARLGGDEFGVLCEELTSRSEALSIAERLRRVLAQPLVIADEAGEPNTVSVGASIGVAFLTSETRGPAEALREADAAMYHAKRRGRDRVEVFRPTMRTSVGQRLELERELRAALEREELTLGYRPVVALDRGTVAGVEAVVQWAHPERGLLTSSDFMDVAEESGLALPLARFALGTACEDAVRLEGETGTPLWVSVSVPALQLVQAAFLDHIAAVLEETRLAAHHLTLEVSEVPVGDAAEPVLASLRALRETGVRVTLAHFGMGSAPVALLRHHPVEAVKLAPALTASVGSRGGSRLVGALVELGHALGAAVIADGVGSRAQLEELRTLGCDLAVGAHLGAARSVVEAGRHLRRFSAP